MSANTLIEIVNRSETLSNKGEIAAAIDCYKQWLASNPAETHLRHVALFNMGSLLRPYGQLDEAIAAYHAALQLQPNFYQAAVNLGLAYEAKGEAAKALSTWNAALQPIEAQTLLLNHSGRLCENLKNYDEAEKLLKRSVMISPDQFDALQHYLHIRQKKCEWPVLEPIAGLSEEELRNSCGPLGILALTDDPLKQLQVISEWIRRKIPPNLPHLSSPDGYKHEKLRLGYMSCDFRWHAVSILTAELFELHNREQFEIYAIDFSTDDGGAMRQRVLAAMNHHLPIHTLSDEEAARLIREHEIDILIDLTGLTAGARPTILAYKPAPVQISYLGFVGTCGMPEIDYILADRFVIPESLAEFYMEKPLYLPEIYQANDSKREIAATPSRESCGLPEQAFVYCSFNGSYKITPEVFAVWMRILARVPNSVLWLIADNDWARNNLSQAALKHGISPERLIFAGKVPPMEYLARFKVADLMLDTSPYNAGTTASDALWVGLPVLTCPGRTFASRMAGSLLRAVGLPELIATDWHNYEDIAVRSAQQPEQLKSLRHRLLATGHESALFDSERFVRNLEETLKTVAREPSN